MSSPRLHISFTGRRAAFEIRAASIAASWFSRRPNEPPPRTTWTRTFDLGSPIAEAMLSRASIGVWEENQISARSARTSATAVSTSIGAWLTKANSNSPSTCADPRGGAPTEGTAARNRDRMAASDNDASGPGRQVMRRASRALKAWWKDSATTATPCGDLDHRVDAGHRAGRTVVDRDEAPT